MHARNRLSAATLFTGITTFGLLGLALSCGATDRNVTPSLLITRLQAQTEQYKQSLQDTEAAQRAPPSTE